MRATHRVVRCKQTFARLTVIRERTTIREVGGMTEYLVATLALVLLCGCAIVAYTGLDAMERDEEERARWRQRALRPVVATPVPRRVATPNVPLRLAQPQPHWRGGSVIAHADWLEERVRRMEEQLDQLVRDSQHASRA